MPRHESIPVSNPQRSCPMSTEENKALALRLAEQGFNSAGDLTAIDELVASDFVDHNPLPGLPPLPPGLAGFKELAALFYAAFPDLHYSVEDMIAEGDKVMIRYTAWGTNQGEVMGMPPTGKRMTFTGFDFFRIAGGKMVEWWHQDDLLGMLQQFGMIPSLGGHAEHHS